MDDLRKTQESFARKAQAQPEHRFADLYHLICREAWIWEATQHVLKNAGSRTAGVDGINRKHLQEENEQQRFVQGLREELKTGTYRPMATKRKWIPKANGKQRPLGIPTLKDRVVQMLVKMLIEPIFESDFLNCSNGFRPGRRTLDCIALCRSRITTQNKYLWVIEGDIKGCFDHVQHAILMKLVKRRIKDERVNTLIEAMLRAGIMEDGLFHRTTEGTPQGGILSPLLANIYLHEFDKWWWEKYGKLTLNEKAKRRQAGLGNCILTRYADDFILLCNGPKQEVERLRDEVKRVLWDTLQLELSLEKTSITHVTDGFDFLGFYVEWKLPKTGKPWLRVTPSKKSIERFKHTVKTMTERDSLYQAPLDKVKSLNRVMRGWNQYYEYANATHDASKLTFWANKRLFIWLRKRHKQGAQRVINLYRMREKRGRSERWNLGVKDETGSTLFLYQLTDLPRKRYRTRKRLNPYLEPPTEPHRLDTAFPKFWNGHTNLNKATWAELRLAVLERDGYCCVKCGNTYALHIHHINPRREGGSDELNNLETLCLGCHAKTNTYGRPSLNG